MKIDTTDEYKMAMAEAIRFAHMKYPNSATRAWLGALLGAALAYETEHPEVGRDAQALTEMVPMLPVSWAP